jgi:hypothetical protein
MHSRTSVLLPPALRTEKELIKLVNEQSTDIFRQYQRESVPYWDFDESNAILHCAKRNVIPRAAIKRLQSSICNRIKAVDPARIGYNGHPLCSFYRKGLLGFLGRQTSSNEVIQQFLPAAQYNFKDAETLPKSDFYFFHPSLAGELKKIHGRSFEFDRGNIIGYEYPFVLPPEIPRNLHVHFGAGRIGLGLVAPIFSKLTNLCIIQRPSSKWQDIVDRPRDSDECNDIILNVPGSTPLKFVVVVDSLDAAAKRAAIDKWKNGAHLLVLSGEKNLLTDILSAASSFSTALRDGLPHAAELLKTITPSGSKEIYCFENELSSVRDFEAALTVSSKAYVVLPVVADRIARDVTVIPEAITVDSEVFGEIYLLGKNARVRRLFDRADRVTVARDAKELEFYRCKKYYLMNTIHAVMAFHAYADLIHRKVPLDKWDQNLLLVPTDFAKVISQILICRLIHDHKVTMRKLYRVRQEKKLFYCLSAEAINYAARIDSSGDTLGRIVSLKAKSLREKFNMRCKEIMTFVRAHWEEVMRWDIPNLTTKENALLELGDFDREVLEVVMDVMAKLENDGQRKNVHLGTQS